MFRNATFNLTMWYLAIVMFISLGFSFTLYKLATNELAYGLDAQTQRIYHQFPVFTNNPYLRVRDTDVSVGAHHIFLRLVYFNLLVLGAAGLSSYWLARRTLQPIEAAHERQKRFTADVSHELRTPLTSLKMSSEVALLDKDATKQELQSALKSNVEDAHRMGQLINNLLRLTQLDTESASLPLTTLHTKELVAAAIERTQVSADAQRIQLINVSKDSRVIGDKESLIQLLVILLDNAIKFSSAKQTVTIDSKRREGNFDLLIKDEGQGISPDALPHVFERLYREESARTTSATGDGYGLGLSIAKMMAERNHASITLTSKLKHGTTATVRLALPEDAAKSPAQ